MLKETNQASLGANWKQGCNGGECWRMSHREEGELLNRGETACFTLEKKTLIFSSPAGGKEKRNNAFIKWCLLIFPLTLKTRYYHPQFTDEKISCNSPWSHGHKRQDREEKEVFWMAKEIHFHQGWEESHGAFSLPWVGTGSHYLYWRALRTLTSRTESIPRTFQCVH